MTEITKAPLITIRQCDYDHNLPVSCLKARNGWTMLEEKIRIYRAEIDAQRAARSRELWTPHGAIEQIARYVENHRGLHDLVLAKDIREHKWQTP